MPTLPCGRSANGPVALATALSTFDPEAPTEQWRYCALCSPMVSLKAAQRTYPEKRVRTVCILKAIAKPPKFHEISSWDVSNPVTGPVGQISGQCVFGHSPWIRPWCNVETTVIWKSIRKRAQVSHEKHHYPIAFCELVNRHIMVYPCMSLLWVAIIRNKPLQVG